MSFKSKIKDVFSFNVLKKIMALIVVVAVVVAVVQFSPLHDKLFGSNAKISQNKTTVKKGNMQVLVAGSGSIYFNNSSKLFSRVNATITKLNYKEGDMVKAGDVIYEIDDTDAQTTMANNQNNLQQSIISAGTSDSDLTNLTVKAPFAGQVSGITANLGDSVSKGATVLTLTDTSKLKLLLNFNATDASQIAIGQSAAVNLTALMQAVNGTVTYISNQPTTTTSGGQLYTVEVDLDNPGAILGGMTASADITTAKGSVSSTNTAAVNYITKQVVQSLTGGTVATLSVKENQKVTAGQVLMTMKNDDVTRAKQSADLKIQTSQSQITNYQRQLGYYKIVAPFDGRIVKLLNKVGDSVTPGTEVADVSDPTQMEFDIPVDELDVAKIAVGQKVNITIDALTETTLKSINGVVDKIAVQGTAVSGVTTFPVTIKVSDSLDKLKGGMNANANIIVSSKQNILYLPIEAVTTRGGRSFVYIVGKGTGKGTGSGNGGAPAGGGTGQTGQRPTGGGGNQGGGNNTGNSNSKEATVTTNISGGAGGKGYSGANTASSSSSKATDYYAGSSMQMVVVGANNDTNIEIVSGLNLGDEIVLPQTQTAASSSSAKASTGLMGGGGGGGFGGGRGN